jgi:4-aminobutyrate aminotransferase-like enzyme
MRATVKVIKEEGLADNAGENGPLLRLPVGGLKAKHKSVAAVRGVGLMIAFDLVGTRPRTS